jgi:hypothetical protein
MEPQRLKQYGYMSAALSYVLLPVVFAPVAFYCGHRLRREDPQTGQRLIGLAIGSVVAWILLFYVIL